jgi:hypothetical protein
LYLSVNSITAWNVLPPRFSFNIRGEILCISFDHFHHLYNGQY